MILLLIVLMIFLNNFFQKKFLFLIFSYNFFNCIFENMDCSKEKKDQNRRVYKNSGIIQQQQGEINDFKKSAESEIQELSKKIDSFQKTIADNRKKISQQDKQIKSVAVKAKAAATAKQKQMDKLAM